MRFWLALVAGCFVKRALAGESGMLVLGVGQRSCGKFIAAVGPIGATKQHKSADGTKYHA